MTLATGSRLGPYEVLGPLGSGGMGEVWRARDTRLGRDVAIKSLPTAFAGDPERLARFEREARLLAALQHPRIAVIHGFEESEGARFLVMELVPGESLAHRLAAGSIPLKEALEIARQIAEGLEAAHEKGIVHRDLKPANVQIGPDGSVKLLDFGLAKAFESYLSGASADTSRSPTISEQMTGTGIILGTAAYMAPEQARGKPVDKRADIWSFGVLLFEMLTGRRLFVGETVSDTLAAVLRAEPEWDLLPKDTPAIVRRLLMRCLERDPKQRLHDAGDARLELEEAIAERKTASTARLSTAGALEPPLAVRKRPWPLALAALAGVALGFAAGRATAPAPKPASGPVHSMIPLPEGTRLSGWASPVLAFSRDGRTLAFVAEKEDEVPWVYVHHLDSGQTQLVPDSDQAEGPFFSPDGKWVAFAVDVSGWTGRPGQLKKFSLATGFTQPIAPIPDYFGGSWGADGTIVMAPLSTSGPWKISSQGGKPDTSAEKVRFAGKDAARALAWPQLLPGGRSALFVDWDASAWGEAAVLDMTSRELHPLGARALFARHTPTGHLLTLQPDATLLAAPFDPARARVAGTGVAVLKGVAVSANWAAALAFSENGSLAYATGYLRQSGRELLKLARLTFSGEVQPLLFEPDTFGRIARPSPDGRRLAVPTWDGSVWVYDLVRGSRTRLPRGKTGDADYLVWTPDGERVVFRSVFQGQPGHSLVLQKADGSGEPEALLSGGEEKAPMGVTPDGRLLLYRQLGSGRGQGFWVLPLVEKSRTSAPRQILEGSFRTGELSPDGRWLAYDSSESGQFEVFARRFPSLDGKVQVSVGEGRGSHWAADGRAIYYYIGDRVLRVRVEPGENLRASAPEALFELPGLRSLTVAPDGKGFFALVRSPDSGIVRQLHLVTNWFEELERLAPSGKKK